MVADMSTLGRQPTFIEIDAIYCINVKKFTDYLIVYEALKHGIEVIRILHGSRDLPSLFYDKEI